MTDQYRELVKAALKTSKAGFESFGSTVRNVFPDEETVSLSVQKEAKNIAKRDAQTKSWERFVRDSKGLKGNLTSAKHLGSFERTKTAAHWPNVVDTYDSMFKLEDGSLPYTEETADQFATHAINYFNDPEYRESAMERAYPDPEERKSRYRRGAPLDNPIDGVKLRDWLFTEGTEFPGLTIHGSTQKELRKTRLEAQARTLGNFRLTPLFARGEEAALVPALKYERVSDIEDTEPTFGEVVADKWDSQLEHGTLHEIITNFIGEAVTDSPYDQYVRAFPPDPNFDPIDYSELLEWSKEIGTPGFTNRIAQSKS